MCGRYQFGDDLNNMELQKIVEQLNRDFAGSPQLARMKSGEIFPTDMAPVMTLEKGGAHYELMEWGFPKWNSSGVVINARAETVAEKPMFRESLQKRRCLIPSTGFYEWRHHEGSAAKEKYLLKEERQLLLYMAGIYNIVRLPDGGTKLVFAILTTEANEYVAPIHDRMPLVLDNGARDIWISEKPDLRGILYGPCEAKLVLLPAA